MYEHFLTSRLADFVSWRDGLGNSIDQVIGTLTTHALCNDDMTKRLEALRSRVQDERLTVSFVAEAGRGKSELINALFFSERGTRLLPSGPSKTTLCVTEVRYDAEWLPCVRLLPIETRENPGTYADLLAEKSLWKIIPFEADDSDSIYRALAALSETRRVTPGEAVAWGLHGDVAKSPATGKAVLVDAPRWRHAIVNLPHPLLRAGLVVIDTPSLSSLAAEPELSRQRIPQSDCVVFVLDATQGVTRIDLTIWKDYLRESTSTGNFGRAADTTPANRLVALNKIDLLSDKHKGENLALEEIDRQLKNAADLLNVDPIRVVPLSARLGFLGKTSGDRDKLIKSRLYQLERAITRELSYARQTTTSSLTQKVLTDCVDTARANLDESRFQILDKLRQLGELREKNQRLVATLQQKFNSEQDRLESAFKELRNLRALHARLGEELVAAIDLPQAHEHAEETAANIGRSFLAGGVQGTLEGYLQESGRRIVRFEAKIAEIKKVLADFVARMKLVYGVSIGEPLPFQTQRFHTELLKVRNEAEKDYKGAILLLRGGTGLAEEFLDDVARRVVHIFNIAARESSTWMRGSYSEMEKALEGIRQSASLRSENMDKLHDAEIDLAEKISELQTHLDIMRSRHTALAHCAAQLEKQFAAATEQII